MMRVLLSGLIMWAALAPLAPASAAGTIDALPQRVQTGLWDLQRACNWVGGRPGDATQAIESADLDGDGTPDLILDEARFPCRDVEPGAACPKIGCSTYVTLSDHGRWRPALDYVGGYCLEPASKPPKLLTIQKNYSVDGGLSVLHVRYVFKRGMAFQEGRGKC